MFDYKTNDSSVLLQTLGIMIQPGWGMAYPELKNVMMALYRDKVSILNFVPSGWIEDVQKVQDEHPNDLVRIGPAVNKGLAITAGIAPWIAQSQETAEAWHAMYDVQNSAIVAYAAKQQAAGKAQLDQLYRNATFWNRAYQLGSITGIVDLQSGVEGFKGFYDRNNKAIMYGGLAVAALAALWVLTPYITPFLKSKS